MKSSVFITVVPSLNDASLRTDGQFGCSTFSDQWIVINAVPNNLATGNPSLKVSL